MTIGSLVHELFQTVLRRKLTTRDDIKAVSDKMLTDGGMAYTLYASSMNSSEARTEFDGFLDKIYEFMQKYIVGNESKDKKVFILVNTRLIHSLTFISNDNNNEKFIHRQTILPEQSTASKTLRRIFGYHDLVSKGKSMFPLK